ncbi:GNAT family N-acetyltransferase [Streptomyces acidicola]|uniref:GNAT family N-acetyltransferase n=1 Tax=Streptomyces acidicola TaxID=2596892 RepID=A0A5N8WYE6_9ACTN|nr:GNAT family N-acetyltransferase [Streptomyces acidicola]MPY51744.1 GNAT family N-acetyltransferase [Streptomyces acidicola]
MAVPRGALPLQSACLHGWTLLGAVTHDHWTIRAATVNDIAEDDDTGGIVGYALWFPRFSTWTGIRGMHLENLYVRPHARGAGHGKALLAALAPICQQNGYERFEWWVLSWNEPAIDFYKSLGTEFLEEWTVCRLSGEPLAALAARAPALVDQSPAL